MEIAGFLAANAVAVLAPALGRLLSRTGEKLTDRAADRISSEALNKANQLWGTLGPKVRSSPTALRAAQRVAATPENEDFQAALRVELDELLASDRLLRQRVEQQLDELGITRVEQRGDQSVMVGRDNTGTIIYTDSYQSFGGSAGQLEEFGQASAPAKLLIALGLVTSLAGFAIFMIPIVQAFTDSSDSFENPDLTPAAIGFVVMFVGIAIGGLGGLLAGFTRRQG